MRFAYLFATNLLYFGVSLFLLAKKGPFEQAELTDFGLTLAYVALVLWLIPLLVALVFNRLLRLVADVHRAYPADPRLGPGLVLSALLLQAFLLTNAFGFAEVKYLVLVVVKAGADAGILLSCQRFNPLRSVA